MSCKDDHVFECYSHMDLNFIMLGYDVPPSNENKKKKSKTLVDIIKACGEEMPRPDKFTQEMYDAITAPTVGSNISNVVSGVQNAENSEHQQASSSKGTKHGSYLKRTLSNYKRYLRKH